MLPIYLDYNATTPVDKEVFAAMKPYFIEKFGNAASTTHAYGWLAKDAVETAQNQVAEALKCEAQQIVFTSGSTESINLAIKGVWELYAQHKGKHIITTKIEHKAVLDVCAYLEKFQGAKITYLNVDNQGLIDLDELQNSITEETILVSIIHSNNETGVIQPMKKISKIVHGANCILMSDCTQSVGKIPFNIEEMGIDLCCISAHKFYGPKGIGALFYRRRNPRVALQPTIHGGGHQRGMRSGTLNVPLIVGLGKAIEIASKTQQQFYDSVSELRNELETGLEKIAKIEIFSKDAPRLPNTSNVRFKTIDTSRLIEMTNGAIAVSTGSACTSATLKPSHVLAAMSQTNNEELSSIRFSLGKYTNQEDIKKTLEVLKDRISGFQ